MTTPVTLSLPACRLAVPNGNTTYITRCKQGIAMSMAVLAAVLYFGVLLTPG